MRREPDFQRNRFDAGTIVALVLAVLVIVFIAENTRRTKIRFVIPEVSSPLWVALTAAMLLGVVVGWLVARRGDD